MRAVAKKRFRNTWLGNCSYCNIWIKCDMYRHVARYHLDIAQLWRCLEAWCTVWKGTFRSIAWIRSGGRMMYHGTLNVPVWSSLFPHGRFSAKFGRIRSMRIIPGYRLTCSLFSDINVSLVSGTQAWAPAYYFPDGLPDLPARSLCHTRRPDLGVIWCLQFSPVQCLMCQARSAELDSESPRKTRCARRRMRPVRILEESVGVEPPSLTVQDASDLQGAIVYDCRTSDVTCVSATRGYWAIASTPNSCFIASLAAPPQEDFMAISGVEPGRGSYSGAWCCTID